MSDKTTNDKTKPLGWLIGLHVLVLVGLSQPITQVTFVRLIPLSFLISATIMMAYQKHWNVRIIAYCLLTSVVAFAIEVAAVQTGQIFGLYRYGKTLGPKLWDVPVIMGIIWFMLIYSMGLMVKNMKFSSWTNAAIGAAMMVMLDVLIEPVAYKYEMWSFHRNRVPMLNYLSCFVVSYLFLLASLNLRAKLRNELAPYVFCIVAGFFLIANFL